MEPRDQRHNLERKPALIQGGRALLFERLCASAPGTPGRSGRPATIRAREVQDVADSILDELRRLLNTRLPVGVGMREMNPQTIVTYGLPDFSMLNSVSPNDRDALARLIERKISAFEPRLREVRVLLDPDPVERHRLIGTLHALMQTEYISEMVSFPLTMGSDGVTLMQSGPAPL